MTKVERKYANRLIQCNIPPKLPNSLTSISTNISAPECINETFGNFDLSRFMARYMAGERTIRQARSVSRKRLVLAGSHVGYFDPEAVNLHLQVSGYTEALQLIRQSDTLTKEVILKANGILTRENKQSGEIRKIQNWIGAKDPFKARYVCPPPDMVAELLENWLSFVNDKEIPAILRAIAGHCQLASIHPFVEGNGRLARVFADGIISKELGTTAPLLLYRLSPKCPTNAYVKMQELFNVGDETALKDEFWSNAISWVSTLNKALEQVLRETRSELTKRIGLTMLSTTAVELVNKLWQQPILSKAMLFSMYQSNLGQMNQDLEQLIKAGIITQRLLKEPQNTVIYDCPIMFEAYHKMDEIIFKT